MLFQWGRLNNKYLILILFPILQQGQIFFIDFEKNNNGLYKCFNDYLSMIFCGIFYFIIRYFTKTKLQKEREKLNKKKKKELKSLNDDLSSSGSSHKSNKRNRSISLYQGLELEYLKKLLTRDKNKYFYIILISIFYFSGNIIRNVFYDNAEVQILKSMRIVVLSIVLIFFSIKFLAFSLYIHQIFSLIILFLCLTIILIEAVYYHKEYMTVKKTFNTILYYFSHELFYGLVDVLGKRYLMKFIDNVYFFLMKIGIISLIPILIYDIIAYYSGIDDKYHGIIRLLFFKLDILDIALNLLFDALYILGIWLTIFFFTPLHLIALLLLEDFLNIIICLYFSEYGVNEEIFEDIYERGQEITFYFIYPLIFFAVLVFNEIIILNFLGLNYNTKQYIIERERAESDIDDLLNEDNEEEIEGNEETNNGLEISSLSSL